MYFDARCKIRMQIISCKSFVQQDVKQLALTICILGAYPIALAQSYHSYYLPQLLLLQSAELLA